jgi:HlyD family secretion protein
MQRRMYRSLTVATLFGLWLTACGGKKKEAEAEPVVPVEVTEAKRDSIQRIVQADGILYPVEQSNIIPKISAPIKSFAVSRGDHVHKGQLLAILENRDLAAGVTDAKGTYEQASAQYRNTASATVPDELVKAQQDTQAAKQAMDAAQKLLQSREQMFREGAIARRMVDDAATAYAQAKSTYETAQKHLESLQRVSRQEEVKSAAGQMESANGKYQAAQAQLSYSEVRSPIDGVVSDRPLYPGEMAAAGSPLIMVMNLSRVIARANIPVAQAVTLRVGQPARVAQTDAPIEVQGTVKVVSPAVDPNSTTVEVWVEAANPGEKLKSGVTVHISVLAETIKDAVVIPPAALLPSQQGGTIVMVVGADSVAHERKIEVGVRETEKLQVVSGLQPGEKVVTVGGLGLQDGGKVQIGKPGAEKPDKAGGDKGDKDDKDDKGK